MTAYTTSEMNRTNEYAYSDNLCPADLLILAAGFEDRAFHFLHSSRFNKESRCAIIKFENSDDYSERISEKFMFELNRKFKKENIFEYSFNSSKVSKFEEEFVQLLYGLPEVSGKVWIDISGMPTHLICSVLNACRGLSPGSSQTIVYTSACDYHPSEVEYLKLKSKNPNGIEFLPKSMAREMSEVLILKSFSGHRSKEGVSCLAVFAGYEVHRTSGVIDNINPSMLLLLYGRPGSSELEWRLDLSKSLHKKFVSTRRTAIEEVSTLHIHESIEVLEEYYQYLFEDYDFTIAPVCSKMQVVATFLFWERYREIQLVFPLPIGYEIEFSPKGVGKTYLTNLEPRNSLYRVYEELKQ